jgi:hypothetical protein
MKRTLQLLIFGITMPIAVVLAFIFACVAFPFIFGWSIKIALVWIIEHMRIPYFKGLWTRSCTCTRYIFNKKTKKWKEMK